MVWTLLAAVTPEKIADANLAALVSGIDRLTEKFLLLRGMPTAINQNANLNVTADLSELLSRLSPDERATLRTLLATAASRPASPAAESQPAG